MRPGRLDNIDVLCTDVDAMARFYVEVLGLPLLFPREEDWFAVQAGDVTLYFFPGKGAHPGRPADATDDNPPGLESFSFAVDDLDAAIAELDGEVQWSGPVHRWDHPGGTWYRYRGLYDPEGNKVNLTEPHKVAGGP
jgi:catechol 2,3-dioxygenase-like lactoylglutathione lyase family enzyme